MLYCNNDNAYDLFQAMFFPYQPDGFSTFSFSMTRLLQKTPNSASSLDSQNVDVAVDHVVK